MSNTVPNSYPELPQMPYVKTSVAMQKVMDLIAKYPVSKAVKIAAYVMFRNESGNGTSGINNNYTGIQADSGKWALQSKHIVGTVIQKGNREGYDRRFLAFDSVEGNLDFLIDRVQKRGLFVGGTCTKFCSVGKINDSADWAKAYYQSWVMGNPKAILKTGDLKDYNSMYAQGERYF